MADPLVDGGCCIGPDLAPGGRNEGAVAPGQYDGYCIVFSLGREGLGLAPVVPYVLKW